MTTDTTTARTRRGPSVHVVRARKLLAGGLVGGVSGALVCVIIFTVLEGTRGLGSAALGAGLVLFFYTAGQLVMVAFANAGARLLLSAALLSYTTRVLVVFLVLVIFKKHAQVWTSIDPIAIFVSTVAVVAGWLVVEVIVFTRLRVGVFDTEYLGPDQAPDQISDQTPEQTSQDTRDEVRK